MTELENDMLLYISDSNLYNIKAMETIEVLRKMVIRIARNDHFDCKLELHEIKRKMEYLDTSSIRLSQRLADIQKQLDAVEPWEETE